MDITTVLTIIGSILIPMLTGFGWIISKLSSVDQRLSRMEGAFEERGRWESRKSR